MKQISSDTLVISISKTLALVFAIFLGLCLLFAYGVHDYQQKLDQRRAKELCTESLQYKLLPLDYYDCRIDTECEIQIVYKPN